MLTLLRRVAVLLVAALAAHAAAPAAAADMTKTLHVAFPIAENGFDPQAVYDTYSFDVCRAIFEPLYTYDYFARPVRLVPNTAESLPVVTDDGRTYTIKVKRGIYFAADPAFKGKPRELTADDYVYTIKRIIDPKVRSYWLYLLEKNLVGLDDVLARARATGALDYDAPIEGLQALDRYTLRIRFNRPDYAFKWWLATGQFGAVAREVVDMYKDASNRVMEHPVGTGPYMLKQWTRGQRIVLEANPAFREVLYPTPGAGSTANDAAISQGTDRQAAADRGNGRHRGRRGGTAAPPQLRHRRSRLSRSPGDPGRERTLRRRAQAGAREARHRSPPRAVAVDLVLLFQSRRTRWWAATRRRSSRCAGRSAWATIATRASSRC